MNVRRIVASSALGIVLAGGGATAAFADGTYPPSTPEATNTGQVFPTSSVADTSEEQAPSSLAFTGTDALEWGAGGLLLVAAGAGLVLVARRRGGAHA